jgi:hypothetical protein
MGQGTGNLYSRVVYEPIECVRLQVLANLFRFGLDSSFVGHIKQQWNKQFTEFPLQTICIPATPHASKDPESAAEQELDRSMPDPC